MTAEEAVEVVQYLAAAYRTEVSALSMAVWADHLRGVSADVGRESARELAGASQFMPHPSEFLQHARRVAQRLADQQRQQSIPMHTGRPLARDVALARVAELREVVARSQPALRSPAPTPPVRSSRQAKPEPCPYCTVVDGVRFCDGSIVDRHRRSEADRARPPADPS